VQDLRRRACPPRFAGIHRRALFNLQVSALRLKFHGSVTEPEATKEALKRSHDWLLSHARQLIAYTALILGAYLAISGLVRLT